MASQKILGDRHTRKESIQDSIRSVGLFVGPVTLEPRPEPTDWATVSPNPLSNRPFGSQLPDPLTSCELGYQMPDPLTESRGAALRTRFRGWSPTA